MEDDKRGHDSDRSAATSLDLPPAGKVGKPKPSPQQKYRERQKVAVPVTALPLQDHCGLHPPHRPRTHIQNVPPPSWAAEPPCWQKHHDRPSQRLSDADFPRTRRGGRRIEDVPCQAQCRYCLQAKATVLEAAARELQERVRQLEAEREEQQVPLLPPCSD